MVRVLCLYAARNDEKNNMSHSIQLNKYCTHVFQFFFYHTRTVRPSKHWQDLTLIRDDSLSLPESEIRITSSGSLVFDILWWCGWRCFFANSSLTFVFENDWFIWLNKNLNYHSSNNNTCSVSKGKQTDNSSIYHWTTL